MCVRGGGGVGDAAVEGEGTRSCDSGAVSINTLCRVAKFLTSLFLHVHSVKVYQVIGYSL